MRVRWLIAVAVAALTLLAGCPLRQLSRTADVREPEPTGGAAAEPTASVATNSAQADHPALRRSRLQDRPVLQPIIAYLRENPGDETVAGLDAADWVSYEQVMEEELTPEQVGEDAMIYKIVEEDAWLSVLFGPPFSEFHIEFRLAPADDGSFEVISCETLPELGGE